MNKRLELQALLEEKLGSNNVYFQPPPNLQMKYPAIVYFRSQIDLKHADNIPYAHMVSYEVTLIDKNPESPILSKIIEIPKCRFDRHYAYENLHHDVFTIFY